MGRKKVKLALVANENSRAINLKKKMIGLVKKVRELTILYDVKACMIIFSSKEVEPMVWSSVEGAQDLLGHFFALSDFERMKKETSLESYLKEKTKKVKEKLMKNRKKKKEHMVDQLMVQLNRGRKIDDLNLREIYGLLSFSKDKIILFRNRLDFMQYPPIRDPPVNPFDVESEDLRTTTNDVFMIGGDQDDERAENTDEASNRISICTAIRDTQYHYLMDQWVFASSEPFNPQIHQTIEMEMGSYNENPYPIRYLSYQGSSSNGNSNLEMDLIGPPMTTFHGMVGSVSQPLQHNNMNNNPIVSMSQPRQYPFEERSNINKGDSQFHRSNNTISTSNGLRQEPPPPPNRTTAQEGNYDTTLFDINIQGLVGNTIIISRGL